MTIGQTIGAARIEQGLSIEELSEKTRIRPAVLVGIESDNFDACGGEAYARGHIRSLATTLGLDAAVLLDQFATQVGAPSRSAITVEPIEQPTPIMERANRTDGLRQLAGSLGIQDAPRGRVWLPLVSALGVLLAAGGLFTFFSHRGSSQMLPVPSASPSASVRPTPTASSTPSPDPSGGDGSPSSSTEPLPSDTSSTGAVPIDSVTPDPSTSVSSGTTIELTVTGQAAWVSAATTKGGDSIYQGLLSAGQTKTFTSDTTIYLVIGDAGAVNLRVNGYDLGTPGTAGQVIRHTYGPGNPMQ
jgi:cytoskeletal protein RodZ